VLDITKNSFLRIKTFLRLTSEIITFIKRCKAYIVFFQM